MEMTMLVVVAPLSDHNHQLLGNWLDNNGIKGRGVAFLSIVVLL